jgi:hypothetical protein
MAQQKMDRHVHANRRDGIRIDEMKAADNGGLPALIFPFAEKNLLITAPVLLKSDSCMYDFSLRLVMNTLHPPTKPGSSANSFQSVRIKRPLKKKYNVKLPKLCGHRR